MFTPAADYHGPASFTYTISDGQGGSDTATVTIEVTPVNDNPHAVNDEPAAQSDALVTPEDTALTIAPATLLANDSDPDGDPLSITSVQGAVNGTVALVEGNIVFTPAADYHGPASFTYTISDGQGGSDTATVTIEVTPVNDNPHAVNDAPAAQSDALVTPEDTALTIAPATLLANDSDPDGDPLSITSVQAAVHGTVALVEGNIVFTPAADYHGPASFTYTISDGQGGSDTATVTIEVTPVNDNPDAVNDAPAAQSDALVTPEDTALTIAPATLLANDSDPDGDPLSITSVQAAVHGTVALVEGNIVFTPAADYHGPASFTYTISDGQGGSDTATVTIEVTPVNDNPHAVNDAPAAQCAGCSTWDGSLSGDALVTPEDTALTIAPATLLANDSDPDGDPLSITSVQGAVNGTVALVEGNIVFTPAADYHGPASFTYTISDGQGGSDTATVSIEVTPVNDPPVSSDDSVTTAEDTSKILSLTDFGNYSDVENSALASVKITTLENNGSLEYKNSSNNWVAVTLNQEISAADITDGKLRFVPDSNEYASPYTTIGFHVSDGTDFSASAYTLTVNVTPVDDFPLAVNDEYNTAEDSVLHANLASNDTLSGDGGNVWSKASDPSHGTVTINTDGTFSYTPTADYHGTDSFTYTITDVDGDTSTATVNITVEPAYDEPMFVIGSSSNDNESSTVPFTVPPSNASGVINGGAGDDVLMGDPGGSRMQPGDSANIALVLDTSGSMNTTISGITRLQALKNAVINALDSLYNSSASDVRVHIVDFDTNASSVGTFTLTHNGVDDLTALNSAKAAVNALIQGGNTNYEAGLQSALSWINSSGSDAPLSAATINKVVFISDGEPNRALNNSGSVVSVTATEAIQHILGTYNPSGTSNDDKVSEVGNIIAAHYTLEAVGINVAASALNLLSQVEGATGDGADNVTTASQLSDVIGHLAGGSIIQTAAGNDVINGGVDGNDIIFGDVPNTDALAATYGLAALSFPPGSGWAVFQALENGESAIDPGWSRADTLAYIQNHQAELATESGRAGGDDIINAGLGDDTVYGQEGNDIIFGDSGNDIISGGSGNDTIIGGPGNDILTGGAGVDTFKWTAADIDGNHYKDTITDFSINPVNGDKLDLSAVLNGDTNTNLDNYLQFSKDGVGDVVISVHKDGNLASTPDMTIIMEGHGATDADLAALQNYLLTQNGLIH